MPTFCIRYDNEEQLSDELQRKLKDLYTPAPVSVHPDFDRSCAKCEKNGGCVGFCDDAKNQSMSYAEFKERTAQLEYRMSLLENQAQAFVRIIDNLKDRLQKLESIPLAQSGFTELVAEPLHDAAPMFGPFDVREELLRMQIHRMGEGNGPLEGRVIAAAIKHVDDALAVPTTAGKRSDSGRY